MSERRLFAVRGAITLTEDSRDEILSKTQVLLKELFARNSIDAEDVVSIIFTATDDLHSEFPAAAARMMGLSSMPLLCARELDVRSSLAVPRCIRVLVHFYGLASPEPVYLEDAVRLRELPEG